MAFELSTVGAKVVYAVATEAGTRPTTGYIELLGLTEAPEIELTVETLDASNLSDRKARYIPGRLDPGGEQVFTANNTSAFRTLWETFVTAAETAFADGKETYIAYIVDGDDDAYYWTGMPQALGHGGLAQNSVVTCSPKVVCTDVIGYEAKPTLVATPETYLVTFEVTDTGGAHLAGATIVVGGKNLTTNANGFANTYLTNGSHAYVVSAANYDDESDYVVVSSAAVLEEVAMTEKA